mgnify:CR=1 FL=1
MALSRMDCSARPAVSYGLFGWTSRTLMSPSVTPPPPPPQGIVFVPLPTSATVDAPGSGGNGSAPAAVSAAQLELLVDKMYDGDLLLLPQVRHGVWCVRRCVRHCLSEFPCIMAHEPELSMLRGASHTSTHVTYALSLCSHTHTHTSHIMACIVLLFYNTSRCVTHRTRTWQSTGRSRWAPPWSSTARSS